MLLFQVSHSLPSPCTHTHTQFPHIQDTEKDIYEVGTDISKVFDGEIYRDFIVDVNEGVDDGGVLYSVQYEDSDEEDLDTVECRIVVKYCRKIDSGEINEWEIGEE